MPASTFLLHSVLVALGGAMGAWLRYLVGLAWLRGIGPVAAGAFPWATLTVNLVGSFAMGLLAGVLARQGQGGEEGQERQESKKEKAKHQTCTRVCGVSF